MSGDNTLGCGSENAPDQGNLCPTAKCLIQRNLAMARRKQKKRWSELSPAARSAVVIGAVVEAAVTTIALRDLIRDPPTRCAVRSWSGFSASSCSRSGHRSTWSAVDVARATDLLPLGFTQGNLGALRLGDLAFAWFFRRPRENRWRPSAAAV